MATEEPQRRPRQTRGSACSGLAPGFSLPCLVLLVLSFSTALLLNDASDFDIIIIPCWCSLL